MNASATSSGGASGGGGAYAEKYIPIADITAAGGSVNLTVGAGGTSNDGGAAGQDGLAIIYVY